MVGWRVRVRDGHFLLWEWNGIDWHHRRVSIRYISPLPVLLQGSPECLRHSLCCISTRFSYGYSLASYTE